MNAKLILILIIIGLLIFISACSPSEAILDSPMAGTTESGQETQAVLTEIALPSATKSPQATPTKTPTPKPPTLTPTSPPPTEVSGELLWFAPNFSRHLPENPDQKNECWDLFLPDAPWAQAKQQVNVIQIDQLALESYRIDENEVVRGFPLPGAIESIQETGLSLSIQVNGPGNGICSGEEAAARDLAELAKIKQLGGEINFIVIPAPIEQMVSHGSDNNCSFTFEEAAEQLSLYIISLRAQFPTTKIGIYEPLGGYSAGPFPHLEGTHHHGKFNLIFERILAVLESDDETIDFFHMISPKDLGLFLPDYGQLVYGKISEIEDFFQSRSIRFGVIYFSQLAGEGSDARFFEDILHIKELILRSERDHNDFVLQSYLEHPTKCLPEDEPYTYTNLINEFDKITTAPTPTPQPTYDNKWQVDYFCEQHVGCERLEVKNMSDHWVNIVLKSREFWGATKMFSIPPRGHDWINIKPGRYDYVITSCGGAKVYTGDHTLSGRWYMQFKQKWCK